MQRVVLLKLQLIFKIVESFDDTVAMELLDCTLPPFPG
jgi:hypothetical protein